MTRVCVFCGSSAGVDPAYAAAARLLGGELVRRRIGLVYGGGSVGLMGTLADAVLAGGGEVIGVIPQPLAARELAHAGVADMRIVASMHERKATMEALADGFIALPGGLGTLEETLEILTWAQLGIHRKPVGVLNVEGYYDGLLRLLGHAVREGFVRAEYFALLLFGDTPAELLDRFAAWTPPALPGAWLRPSQT
ncbi:MAG TPA: TIGR00730 family Rossman fold protein [Terriglobales bacterium]|nr:TIGR00730 family Rossman fold protein [Terriglobales bacterium]